MAIDGGLHNGEEEGENGEKRAVVWRFPARDRTGATRGHRRRGGGALARPPEHAEWRRRPGLDRLRGGEGASRVGPARQGEGRRFPSRRWQLDGPRLGRLA
jgi:hypothetical protein